MEQEQVFVNLEMPQLRPDGQSVVARDAEQLNGGEPEIGPGAGQFNGRQAEMEQGAQQLNGEVPQPVEELQDMNPAEGDAAAQPEGAADENYKSNDGRGWIMAVAGLFATMSFQAIKDPPSWMKTDLKHAWKIVRSEAGTPAEKEEAKVALNYVMFNTLTFAASLVLVWIIFNPTVFSLRVTMGTVRSTTFILLSCAAASYTIMVSRNSTAGNVAYAVVGAILAIFLFPSIRKRIGGVLRCTWKRIGGVRRCT